jgi:hypothetical protein
LPQIGVLTVIASKVAVTIQVNVAWDPARSLTMRGIDVETIELARSATRSPVSRPVNFLRTEPPEEVFLGFLPCTTLLAGLLVFTLRLAGFNDLS